ncbi:hypothetical protein [Rhodothermus bifroesti]|uniref:Lipoprotein n=1 Tax=Rhodothermus marinus TaxID=29549 RepID=A0A7V2AZN9_RHOMR|nr:hypothetical protein [Rhodothermus bifroesti]GBD01407.1 hypothetical protein HRbin18_01129 [bacterium HR18]
MKRFQSGLALLLLVSLAACDVLQHTDTQTLSDEEAATVATIVAQSLADQSDGLVTDFYEATATFDRSGMYYMGGAAGKDGALVQDPRPWRGMRRNFQLSYDSTTGVHTLSFLHEVDHPVFHKSIEARLQYIFKDTAGQFIARPRAEADRIATIDFEGYRRGEVSQQTPAGNRRSSSFERRATWHVEGLEAESDTILFMGEQTYSGTFHLINVQGREVERVFSGQLVTDGPIKIAKPTTNEALEYRAYGTLAYQLQLVMRVNGREQTRTVEGTIELNGDGSALLRFFGTRQAYRIVLGTGEVEPLS